MKKYSVFICCLFLLVVCLSGCKGPKAASNSSVEIMEKDSTYVKFVPRLVPYPVPGEKVIVKEYIECDPITNKPIPISGSEKNGKANASYKIDDDGKLTVEGGCDSLQLLIEVKDTEITNLKETSRSEKKTETKIEYKTRWYDITARCISILFCVLLLIRLKNTL